MESLAGRITIHMYEVHMYIHSIIDLAPVVFPQCRCEMRSIGWVLLHKDHHGRSNLGPKEFEVGARGR